MEGVVYGLTGLVTIALVVGLYFAPTIVAAFKQRNIASIAVLNFFLGWTIIGWIIALVWALQDRPDTQTVIVQQISGPNETEQQRTSQQETPQQTGNEPKETSPKD